MSKRDVMVCVTGQKNCERLIREGAQIAAIREVGVHVVHVAHEGERFMGSAENEAEALEYLLRRSNDVGADMTVLHAKDPKGALCEYAQRNPGSAVWCWASRPGRMRWRLPARWRPNCRAWRSAR